jgi:hypothetical protein
VRIQFYLSDVGHGQWPRHSSLIRSSCNSFIFNLFVFTNYCSRFLETFCCKIRKQARGKESLWTIRYPLNQ